MCTQENVAGQRLQNQPHALVVLGNLWILPIVNQLVAWVDIGTANDHHVVGLVTLSHLHCPCGAAFCMSGSKTGNKYRFPQPHFVPVVQHPVDLGWLIKELRTTAVLEVGLTSG